MTSTRSIHFVSLGCPKNRVDSEVMLGVAERAGFHHVADPSLAEVIVVNTCGFIDAAKKESIDTILELAENKKTGVCQSLVVTGCLTQRHPEELAEGLPEVDHLLGSSDMLKLEQVLTGNAERILVGNPADWVVRSSDPRTLSTRGASAYVKLAEGCNRKCSFCIIPSLRGKQRSRTVDDIVGEVTRLASNGVLEVNLISQDTVSYGRDAEGSETLETVVKRVADIDGLRWVRLHYLYPEALSAELIELLAHHPKVLPYVDMPLQHASDAMLKRMKRGHGGARLRQLVERLRNNIPDLVFRTAFIVGHPGESQADFDELLEFIEWAKFDRLGVFHYSDEPGTHSYTQEDKVPARVTAARAKKLMSVQRRISRAKNKQLIGKRVEVLVEGPSEENEWVMVGRHRGQAPDIDGCVFLSGDAGSPGRIVTGTVSACTDYDLVAEIAEDDEESVGPTTELLPSKADAAGTKPTGKKATASKPRRRLAVV
jgi:ribosomal protein S12 methylthiotransferase